jgi:hypothetical protein
MWKLALKKNTKVPSVITTLGWVLAPSEMEFDFAYYCETHLGKWGWWVQWWTLPKQTMFNELCILSEYSVEIVQSIGGK